ncbi:MAG: tannase/feruloyl esterase family alpha/beta hydrolase [Caulobacter sp.]|nr:tannase/feruloyl esterase family alpha/beta hydrolase [Caulobacter sp.]
MKPVPSKRRWAPAMAGLLGLGAALAVGLSACASGTPAARTQCEALEKLNIAGGKVVSAKLVGAGFKMSWKTALIGVWGFKQPQSCRVTLVLKPSPDSHINTEVWLPATGWNNRLFGVGNGGLAGSIDYLSMNVGLSHGYAVAATDTGHKGDGNNGEWALNHPELLKDFGWRAIHETAVAAKTLIAAYYGRPVGHSYFISGSNGGREGLMEAQRFPEDYDGIVAGAPAFDGPNNVAASAWTQTRLLRTPASYILKAKLPAIQAAVLKQCDGLDGLKDGLIENPMVCRFDPAAMLCQGKQTNQCLNANQVESLRAIYSGPGGSLGDSRNWGYPPGGEEGWKEWGIGNGPRKSIQYHFALEFPRYLVYGDPKWELSRFDFAKDRPEIARVMGVFYTARDPDLTRFKARGGKLILYHGWSDQALVPQLTIDYFNRMTAAMGKDQTDGFARLYMAPGVWHVIGGPGPNVFGQIPGNEDPRYSVTAAIEQWVEKGVPPGPIIASKYKNDLKPQFLAGSMTAIRTRLLCPWPLVQRYKGAGSIDDYRSFACGPAE